MSWEMPPHTSVATQCRLRRPTSSAGACAPISTVLRSMTLFPETVTRSRPSADVHRGATRFESSGTPKTKLRLLTHRVRKHRAGPRRERCELLGPAQGPQCPRRIGPEGSREESSVWFRRGRCVAPQRTVATHATLHCNTRSTPQPLSRTSAATLRCAATRKTELAKGSLSGPARNDRRREEGDRRTGTVLAAWVVGASQHEEEQPWQAPSRNHARRRLL
jgi:hypothetical protein